MVGLAVVLQVAVAAPQGLPAARAALDAADTTAAVATLETLLTQGGLSSDGLGAMLLLEWIGRSETQDSARRIAARAFNRYLAIWRDQAQGKVLLPLVERHRLDLLWVRDAVGRDVADKEIQRALSARGEWHAHLEEIAAEFEDQDSLLAGAVRWARALHILTELEAVVDGWPALDAVPPGCAKGCVLNGPAPVRAALFGNLVEAGRRGTLDTLFASLLAARHAPWPMAEFAARAQVGICALLRTGIAPTCQVLDTMGLGPRTAAELSAVRLEFAGKRAQAARVMDEAPEWFAHLDAEVGALGLAPRSAPLLWRATWPLYLEGFNARLVAHRSRLLLADIVRRLARGPRQGLFLPYGDPGSLVRIGVPLGVARVDHRTRAAVVTFVPAGMHETVVRPGAAALDAPLDLLLAARPSDVPSVTTGFVAEDYTAFGPLEHQVVQYVRDGREVAALHVPGAPGARCPTSNPLLGFFLLDSRLRELQRRLDIEPSKPIYRFHITVDPGTYVYSLEMLDRGCRAAERARYVLTVRSPAVPGLSDPMLLEQLEVRALLEGPLRITGDPPVTVRPGLQVTAGGAAEFYWEVYGVAADDIEPDRLSVDFEIRTVTGGRVPLRDLGGLAEQARRARAGLDLTYTLTVPAGDEPLGCALAVGLPNDASGVHLARLRVTDLRTGVSVTAERAFFVRPAIGPAPR